MRMLNSVVLRACPVDGRLLLFFRQLQTGVRRINRYARSTAKVNKKNVDKFVH